jgi:hypothetical protein
VQVGSGSTCARYRLAAVNAVRAGLAAMVPPSAPVAKPSHRASVAADQASWR